MPQMMNLNWISIMVMMTMMMIIMLPLMFNIKKVSNNQNTVFTKKKMNMLKW